MIEISREGGSVGAVAIQSSRPLGAARVLEGRDPASAMGIVPMLYSVCGVAQASAASQALTLAAGEATRPEVQAAREVLLLLETVREHSLRILLDWPGFVGDIPDAESVKDPNRLLPAAQQALFPDGDAFLPTARIVMNRAVLRELMAMLDAMLAAHVFDGAPAQWLDNVLDRQDLFAWAEAGATVAARLVRRVLVDEWMGEAASPLSFLAPFDVQHLERRLAAADAEDFIAAPCMDGTCYETGPLARQRDQALVRNLLAEFGNGMLSRLVARLVELAGLAVQLRERLASLQPAEDTVLGGEAVGPGVAISQVEAARGRLVHRVQLDQGTIRRYQILAPTEWNFHPHGVVAQGLAALDVADTARLRRQAGLFINAVDPCVGYELRLH